MTRWAGKPTVVVTKIAANFGPSSELARLGFYMDKKSCPFCGKPVSISADRCPFCREAITRVQVSSPSAGSGDGSVNIRRGLLWALLAGVIYYFAGGHSNLKLPIEIPSFVNVYLTPILFLGGAGMALYGLFQKMRS